MSVSTEVGYWYKFNTVCILYVVWDEFCNSRSGTTIYNQEEGNSNTGTRNRGHKIEDVHSGPELPVRHICDLGGVHGNPILY